MQKVFVLFEIGKDKYRVPAASISEGLHWATALIKFSARVQIWKDEIEGLTLHLEPNRHTPDYVQK